MSVPKPVLRRALTEPPIALPAGSVAAAVDSDRPLAISGWLLTALFFLVPLLTYWPATFYDYGLRDDYSNLREAHEEPGTILNFCASHARPIYGWLLQATYGQTDSVQSLHWMRFAASLLLGAVSLVMFRGLRALGWSFSTALCFAILLTLVPSAQVIAGWAIGWPYAATALLAIAGFFTVEGALTVGRSAGPRRAVSQWIMALCLMVVGALIYQPSAMFYVVPLAAALIAQRRRSIAQTARWLAVHIGFIIASLGLAYCTMIVLYAAGVFVKSGRIAFEHHWVDKLSWFFHETMPNALSLFVLNDNNLRDHGWYIASAVVVGLLLVAGAVVEWRRHGRARGLIWTVALVGLPILAASVSLVASERYATYRTIFAMTAVLLCFMVASARALTAHWSESGRRLLATVVVGIAFFTAQHHVYALIAVPQGNEWQLILSGAKHVHLNGPARPRIFAIASAPSDISTVSIYHDEFGSLSSNSEWVPKEMFKRAMHDLHPEVANLESRYDFSEGYKAEGYKLPPGQHYDVVIDMHQLHRFHTDN
ncbi:MAG TPA: glucosyltransferase domain-containing protein [Steroidobacteraceae bacterium]|nr:glucosyltransferase domain-containing protein [Steroidobacteraceae bacterium]